MSKSALLIVDPQNDFCPGGAIPVRNADKIFPVVNKLIERAKKENEPIIVSRCWHDDDNRVHFKLNGPWDKHGVKFTKGAEFHPALQLPEDAIIVSKGMGLNEDAYPAFDGRDEFGRSLLEILRLKFITRLEITGLALDYCVKASALKAKKYGFDVVVYKNATMPVNINSDDGYKAELEMQKAGILITNFPEPELH